MDKSTQSTVSSDRTTATLSDSSLSSVDTNLSSNLLPTVTPIEDQVNVEIRQNHSEYFTHLPIVIQRDEVTIVDDKSSNISSEPSSSSIQSNNDLTKCFKQPLVNELFEDIKKCGQAENIVEEQSNMSNLKHNGKNENNEIVQSNKTKIENSSDCKTLSENIVFKDVNFKTEMNKNVKKEMSAFDDEFNLEKIGNSIEFPDDKKLHKNLGSKSKIQSIVKNNIGESCKVEFNTEIGQNDKVTNELVPNNKTVYLDHQYSKSLLPENMVALENLLQNKEVNKLPELTEKIGSFQTNNKINKLTSQESEINHIENTNNNLQGSVINEEYINHSLIENTNLNQMIKSDLTDTTNEIPITVNDEGISKLNTKFPIYNLLDDEGKGELIQGITDFSKTIQPKIEEILKDDSVSFEELEKCVEENISRLMHKEFDEQLKSLTDNFIHRTDTILQNKYDSVKLHLRHLNAIVNKHDEDLLTDKNSIPRKIRRNMKVQTKRYKNKKNGSHLQESTIEKDKQNKTSDLSTQASNSDNQNAGSLDVMTDSALKCSPVIAPKVISVKSPKILNAYSLPPVPPAIPISIDDDLVPLPSVHHQECHTFKSIPQVPIMKTANKKSSKVVARDHSVIINTSPVEAINLPLKRLKDKDPSSSACCMSNKKKLLLPGPTLIISDDNTSEEEDCMIIDSPTVETINLLSPEPLNDDGSTPLSDISKKKKHIRVKEQLLPVPTLIISDEDSSEIAYDTQTPNIHNHPTEFVDLLSPEPAESIEESNINISGLQIDDPVPSTSSMPILPLSAEPIEGSNIYLPATHIDDPLPSDSSMPILPLLLDPVEESNVDVPAHHSVDPLPTISSTLEFSEPPKELINNLSVLKIDDPLPSTSSMPILPLYAEPIKESNINIPMQHNIAPLPGIPIQKSLQSWKPLPPAPKLKISNNQTSEDIELILDMETSGIEQIKSFEIYCYNEVSSEMLPTSVETWQKTGDVKFLPLPIKCCFKKGSRNIICHYIVRAVDIHDRVGPFSLPESVFIK